MIVNIMDLRARPYRWKTILAVVQSAAKDNVAEDADTINQDVGVEIDYAERDDLSLREAILWADKLDGMVTLYIHDNDAETVTDDRPL